MFELFATTTSAAMWQTAGCFILLLTVWWNWNGLRPKNLKVVAKFLLLTKAFTASFLAESVGVSGHQLLLCNNVIGEIITYLSKYLSEYRFSTSTNRFSVSVSNVRATCDNNHAKVTNKTFHVITEAVVKAACDQSIQICLCRTSLKDVSVATDIQDLRVCLKGVPLCVSGRSTDGSVVAKWTVASDHFASVHELCEFLDSFDPSVSRKQNVMTHLATCVWIPPETKTHYGKSPNPLFSAVSSAMAPYYNLADKILTSGDRHTSKPHLSIERTSDENCAHTFQYEMHEIEVKLQDRNDVKCWQVGTNASYQVLQSFIKHLQAEQDRPQPFKPSINVFRWHKKTPVVAAGASSGEAPSTNPVDCQRATFDWQEYSFVQQKEMDQYFLTENVKTNVLDRLASAISKIEMRKRIGVGLNQNFLLEGQPGTGKTTLAYYFAQTLQQRYQMSVSIVHFESTVFENTDTFRNAVHQLDTSKDVFDTLIVIVDEADKLLFFRQLAAGDHGSHSDRELLTEKPTTAQKSETKTMLQKGVDNVDVTAFLTWIGTGSVAKNKSRFVFAMVNDVNVLESANRQTSNALFREGRFGHRVHVGGCDSMQFRAICEFVFADTYDFTSNTDAQIASLFNKMLDLCDQHKDDRISPLTVQKVQSLILQSNFDLVSFLRSTLGVFRKEKE